MVRFFNNFPSIVSSRSRSPFTSFTANVVARKLVPIPNFDTMTTDNYIISNLVE